MNYELRSTADWCNIKVWCSIAKWNRIEILQAILDNHFRIFVIGVWDVMITCLYIQWHFEFFNFAFEHIFLFYLMGLSLFVCLSLYFKLIKTNNNDRCGKTPHLSLCSVTKLQVTDVQANWALTVAQQNSACKAPPLHSIGLDDEKENNTYIKEDGREL